MIDWGYRKRNPRWGSSSVFWGSGICSCGGRPTLEAFVDSFHLANLVSCVVSSDDVTHAKPHPEPVQCILDRIQIPPTEALVVGDASFDILMGRAAGCRTVGVTYGNQTDGDDEPQPATPAE